MGFPTRACMELTSDDAMKQSLRLVKDVSLSMSWNAESLPAGDTETGVNGLCVKKASFAALKAMQACARRFMAVLGNYKILIVKLRNRFGVSSQL